MAATDVQNTLALALAQTGVPVKLCPRLLSADGSAFVAHELAVFLSSTSWRIPEASLTIP